MQVLLGVYGAEWSQGFTHCWFSCWKKRKNHTWWFNSQLLQLFGASSLGEVRNVDVVSNVAEKYLDLLLKSTDDALATICALARGELAPKNEEKDDDGNVIAKDRRVEFEAARLLVRITERRNVGVLLCWTSLAESLDRLVENKGVQPILELITSPYEILQGEGLKAIFKLACAGKRTTSIDLQKTEHLKEALISLGVAKLLAEFRSPNQQFTELRNQILSRLNWTL